MKIAIGNDHAAVALKNEIAQHLRDLGHEVVNFGTDTNDSVDYPVYGFKVANAVASGECELGVAICGTGIGISMAANKVKGIRCACCSDPYSARMAREHNNANILAFGARVVGPELAKMMVDEWLGATYNHRHDRRNRIHRHSKAISNKIQCRRARASRARRGRCICRQKISALSANKIYITAHC